MAGISFSHKGNFENLDKFLKAMQRDDLGSALQAFGEAGAQALASASPKDTGYMSSQWDYSVKHSPDSGFTSIEWFNHDTERGWFKVAIALHYGHGTRNGGYVTGRNYINSAIQGVFDDIVEQMWAKVVNS